MDVNAEIRAEMARQRVSYADLARRLGYTRQNLWSKLTAQKAVDQGELEKISRALDVPAWEIIRRTETGQRTVA